MSEYKNLFGTSLELIEEALLKGYSADIDLPWHCFTDKIQQFIAGAYELGLNPLPHLRKVFPNLDWEFHTVDAASLTWSLDVGKIVARSDYFWPACYEAEEWFVTAKRKSSDEQPWRILGDDTMLSSSINLEQVGAMTTHPLSPQSSRNVTS